MNAIIFFDDQPPVVTRFVKDHLGPTLREAGMLGQVEMHYVNYQGQTGVRKERDIAIEAYAAWNKNAYDRTAFVLDLNPDLPSLKLSAAFLQEVVTALAQQFGGMNSAAFLGNTNFLATVLTKFPDAFATISKVTTIRKIRKGTVPQQVEAATLAINQPGARIVLAESPDQDPTWLAKVISEWLNAR